LQRQLADNTAERCAVLEVFDKILYAAQMLAKQLLLLLRGEIDVTFRIRAGTLAT
jgi:hypothetical protein